MSHQPSDKSLLFYTDSTYFSGAEKSFALLAQSFKTKGYPVSLVVTSTAAERFSEYVPAENTASRSKVAIGFYFKWVRRLRKERPAAVVVNMWSPYANTLFLMAARRAKIPCITIYHYYQERNKIHGPLTPLRLFAYGLGARLATRILTVSEAHRNVLITQFGFPEAKLGVLLNGTLPGPNPPTFEDHTPRRFLAIGSLENAKGYDFVLNVLSKVTTPWEFTIVGDGPDRQLLEQIVQEKKLPVTFTGRQTNVDQYYTTHDALLHPSHFENLSMAIIESMSYGLTCLANDVGGNRELVINKETGWLLTLNDEAGWQAAITEACSIPLGQLRKAAYERWQTTFTVAQQTNAMEKELLAVLDAA